LERLRPIIPSMISFCGDGLRRTFAFHAPISDERIVLVLSGNERTESRPLCVTRDPEFKTLERELKIAWLKS
jgi:hypothetical protein